MKILSFLVILFPMLSSAQELKVDYLARHFVVNISNQEIKFSGNNLALSLKKRSCSKRIFENFSLYLSDLGKSLPVDVRAENLTYSWKKVSYSIPVTSGLGNALVHLPEEIKRMKIEERIRCSY